VDRELPPRPARLPLLEAVSWFDADPYALAPGEVVTRYARGWRHAGALVELGAEERAYVRALAAKFGSHLDVPA